MFPDLFGLEMITNRSDLKKIIGDCAAGVAMNIVIKKSIVYATTAVFIAVIVSFPFLFLLNHSHALDDDQCHRCDSACLSLSLDGAVDFIKCLGIIITFFLLREPVLITSAVKRCVSNADRAPPFLGFL